MTEKFDPIFIEIMRHELISCSEEMSTTMKQTTRSIVAKEGGDFSAGLLDPEGRVIAQAVPYGLGYFTAVMPHIMKKYRGKFRPGDVIISNDPYGGLSHLPDIALVMPIFWRGDHRGFAAVVQHHTDIGGRFPGGMGLPCAEIYEEGLRLPAVRYYEKGQLIESVREIIAAAVRAPDDVLGDLDAGVAACRRGERALTALFDKYGHDAVFNCYSHLLAHSESLVRSVFRSIPDGSYSCSQTFDDGGGTRVEIAVTLTIKGDDLVVDFTGTGPQVANALNCPPDLIGNFTCNMVFMALLGGSEVPINSGLFAPIQVPVNRVNMPVSIGPGATALTRTPNSAASRAAERVSPSTACLLAA